MLYNFEDLTFGILSVYRFRHVDGFFSVKPRPYAAISIRLQGEGELDIDGKHFSVREGDVMFVPADMPYKVQSLGSEIIVVHLRDCNYREAEMFHPQNAPLLRMLFLRLLEDFSDSGSVNGAKSGVYGILDAMQRDRKAASENAAFDACLKYMEENFSDRSLSIGRVAAVGFMSQSSLGRAFHDRIGMSPKAYLCKLRMNKAVSLLLKNEISVKEVAFACGFSDEKFFSRAFRQKYGFPPSGFKKHLIG